MDYKLRSHYSKNVKIVYGIKGSYTVEQLQRTADMEEFRKAQAEVEKKNEKPMSQKMFNGFAFKHLLYRNTYARSLF